MCPTLPQETLEEIIDHLYDDRNTLLICSLASHAFIPSTRRLLFSRISLFSREIEAAVQMFGDTHGTIARAIRHLEITDRTPPDNRHCWPDTKNVEKTPINVPLLRTRLQSLQVMRLEYICDVHIPSLFWKVTRSLAGVREIQIDQMFCDNSHQFLGFLSSFLSLKSIAVTKCHWSGQPSALIPSCAPELSHVSVLEIGSSAQQYILQWLLSQKVSLSLHTLRLNLGIDVDTAFLVNSLLLEIVSPTLKELYISLENGIRDPQVLEIIDFGCCSNLRLLDIVTRYDPQGNDHINLLIQSIFPQLSSMEQLKELSWSVHIDGNKTVSSFIGLWDATVFREFSWKSLSLGLNASVGPRLEKLRISLDHYPERLHESTETYLKHECFSEFVEGDKLELVFRTP